MSVEVPQVLQLQGGSPLLKAGASFVENLKHAKALDGGNLGSLLAGLMSGGLGSIMQNPMAAITGQLQGAVGQAITQVAALSQAVTQSGDGSGSGGSSASSGSGGSSGDSGPSDSAQTTSSEPLFPLTLTALQGPSGLQAAAASFAAVCAGLSGTGAAPAGGYGLLDLITHAGSLNIFSGSVPTTYSVTTASQPLASGALLAGTSTAVAAITAALVASQVGGAGGDVSSLDQQHAEAVEALTNALQSVLNASSNAIGGFRALMPVLATAAAVGGALAMASSSYDAGDPEWAALLPTLVQPAALTAMQEAAAEMIRV